MSTPLPVDPGNVRVSCLMLTLAIPERLVFSRRSIDDYCRQSHANKELVLIVNGGEASVRQSFIDDVESLGRTDIRLMNVSSPMTLGELRNLSWEAATGDVLCQWDDDDLHHPLRVEKQLAVLQAGGFEAVYLQEIIHYFPTQNCLYWTNWKAVRFGGMPGTLMVKRNVPVRYPTEGQTAQLGEDSAMADLLGLRGGVGYLPGMPHLFVYIYHGKNTWHDGHHKMLVDSLSISQALLRRREAQVREGMALHHLPTDSITARGNNGPAFIL